MNKWGIYLRPMKGGEPLRFDVGVELAWSPKWSPDGKWIAFFRWQTPRTATLFVKPSAGGSERELGSICNNDFVWSADGKSIITPENGDTDELEACALAVFPTEPGAQPRKQGIPGVNPALSPDGRTLAFVFGDEIHLLPVAPDGSRASGETTLAKESKPVGHVVWFPGGGEILYTLATDRSLARRISTAPGAMPRDQGRIDGEFTSFVFASQGGPVLANVVLHDNSFLRLDLHAPEPHFEKLRQLPWNVDNLTVSPDGDSVVYTLATGGETEFWIAGADGGSARRLFQIPYPRANAPAWSPDGKQIAFTAERWLMQAMSATDLFIASIAPGAPRQLATPSEYVSRALWTRDGESLILTDDIGDERPIWKLRLADQSLERITGPGGDLSDVAGNFLYFSRGLIEISRVPVGGGPEDKLVGDAIHFAPGTKQLYFVRQDSNPPTNKGLNVYRYNFETRATEFVSNLGFGAASFQLSHDERFIYVQRNEPQQQQIMIVEELR
jgi:Tol biopolymer transport system component